MPPGLPPVSLGSERPLGRPGALGFGLLVKGLGAGGRGGMLPGREWFVRGFVYEEKEGIRVRRGSAPHLYLRMRRGVRGTRGALRTNARPGDTGG